MIDDYRAPDDARRPAEWIDTMATRLGSRVIRFRHGDKVFEATFAEVGVSVDIATMLERAQAVGHTGSILQRLAELQRARRGALRLPLAWTVNRDRAREKLATYAAEIARDPVNARIDLAAHTRIPDEPGRAIDLDASVGEIERAAHEDDEIVEILTRRVPAKVTLEGLTRVQIEKVVSVQETTFVTFGSGAGRSVNIRNAAGRLDGTVLEEGQVFSFNDVVGPRTHERGFALAPEIVGDEMQPGYGGGTCQVSSTLHIAAVFGALQIVERLAHSRPSSYTQMGLDATVSYPTADLKIRNSLPFPILIRAYFPKATTLRVEILGGDPIARVDYLYGVSKSEDFERRVTVKSTIEAGQRVLHQKGIRGFDVTSIVRTHYLDGRNDERLYYSGYRPAPEVYWVAPGYDLQTLPPLPPHAKAAEGATAAVASGVGE